MCGTISIASLLYNVVGDMTREASIPSVTSGAPIGDYSVTRVRLPLYIRETNLSTRRTGLLTLLV